jgi:hypothetical protein
MPSSGLPADGDRALKRLKTATERGEAPARAGFSNWPETRRFSLPIFRFFLWRFFLTSATLTAWGSTRTKRSLGVLTRRRAASDGPPVMSWYRR